MAVVIERGSLTLANQKYTKSHPNAKTLAVRKTRITVIERSKSLPFIGTSHSVTS